MSEEEITNPCVFFEDLQCPVLAQIMIGMNIKQKPTFEVEGFYTDLPEQYSILSNYCMICPHKTIKEISVYNVEHQDLVREADVLTLLNQKTLLKNQLMRIDLLLKASDEERRFCMEKGGV